MENNPQVRMMDYIVHFNTEAHTIHFQAYPVEDWEQASTGIKGTSYISKEDNQDSVQQFEIGKCLIKLTGSFCWKGIWEGRLYFNDEEYWGEDIQELSDLYNNHIVNWCKQYIKQREPNNSYDE